MSSIALKRYSKSEIEYQQKSHLLKVKQRIPFEKTPEAKAERMKLWDKIDVNKNGILSLAEIDKGFRDLEITEIFKKKRVLIQAFNKTKCIVPSGRDQGDDYIEKKEFRLFLETVWKYYLYHLAFN